MICWFSLKKGLWWEAQISGNIRKTWSGGGSSGACIKDPGPQPFPASSTSCRTYSCSTWDISGQVRDEAGEGGSLCTWYRAVTQNLRDPQRARHTLPAVSQAGEPGPTIPPVGFTSD